MIFRAAAYGGAYDPKAVKGEMIDQGLSSEFVHVMQDPVDENNPKPAVVERVADFLRSLRQDQPLPFWRLEVSPGVKTVLWLSQIRRYDPDAFGHVAQHVDWSRVRSDIEQLQLPWRDDYGYADGFDELSRAVANERGRRYHAQCKGCARRVAIRHAELQGQLARRDIDRVTK